MMESPYISKIKYFWKVRDEHPVNRKMLIYYIQLLKTARGIH